MGKNQSDAFGVGPDGVCGRNDEKAGASEK